MRVAIIGTGSISGVHVVAIKSAGQSIVALCDVVKERAEKTAVRYGIDCPVYDDYRLMIECVKPDAVHVCTPHYLHAEMVEYALGRGVAVLSEKPVCIDEDSLYRLMSIHEKYAAAYGVCFQNRTLDGNVAAKGLLSGARVYGASGAVLWDRDEKYYLGDEWRGKWATEGGGALINQALHTLDLMIDALGQPTAVAASMQNTHLKGVIEVEDEMRITMEYPAFTATFAATTAAKGSYPVFTAFYTDRGVVSVHGGKLFLDGVPHEIAPIAPDGAKKEWGAGHETLIREFYRCLENGEPIKCDFDNCVSTMKTVFAAYKSAKTGKRVVIT